MVVVAGVVTTTQVAGATGDVLGDVLYAVAVYTLLVLLVPRLRVAAAGGLALSWCWAVEGLQATGVASAVNDAVPPAAWLLGSTFAVRDLACYAVGVALTAGTDLVVGRAAARRPGRRATPVATPPPRTSG
nr:DUF2809 domain-containing protein [Cellulosimicrobium arenosum]